MSDIKNIINNILNDREPLNEYDEETVEDTAKDANKSAMQAMMDKKKALKAQMEKLDQDILAAKMKTEDHKPGEDEEYDYEGSMAKTQLCQIHQAATKMMKEIEDNENLPEWVQSKIAVACDYMIKVASYLDAKDEQHDDEKEMEAMPPAPASAPSMDMPKKITPFEPKPISLGRKMMGFSMGDPQPSSGGDF